MIHRIVLTLENGREFNALFINSREHFYKATKGRVSGWVKEAFSWAYSHLTGKQRQKIGIRAHVFKGVTTTCARLARVPFKESMDF